MKRQLVEDLKTRLKFLQEMEKSHRGRAEDLERKARRENSSDGARLTLLWGYSERYCLGCVQVKTLSEEAANRKALIESLRRRLSVATAEKSQREASCTKLKEDGEKKVRCH